MITETEFNDIRPGDSILSGNTTYTIDNVDVQFGEYIIRSMYYITNGDMEYTQDAPYKYNDMRHFVDKIIKSKITCWRTRIQNGKQK